VSGEYFITQSWSQEKMLKRPYYVSVPKPQANQRKLPVFIFLHGNGGNAKAAMNGFGRHRKTIASRYIMVFAQGYRKSWNIVSERSKADDRGFIEAIVLELATSDNVHPNNFTIMGVSNGAALVNQLAIESSLPNIRNYISAVSPLNVWQYDGKQFRAKGQDNNYRVAVTPAKGKRLLNISGVKDELVPYDGGPSKAIPAKDGKLAFVAAEESTFIWARHMGYVGEQLTGPTRTSGDVQIFSYLNGDVVHYKVNNEGHGAMHGISEVMLLDFLQGGENSGQK
jgi:poly(3-hydroxybutyrate) depolymerase